MQSLNIIQVSSLFNWIIFILVVFDRLVANYTPSSDAKSCTPEEEEMVG